MDYGAAGPLNTIADVDGIEVGQAEDRDVRTGVTVVLPQERAVAAGDVRGGGPGTRETDLLDNGKLVQQVDAIVLSGGSAYGLAAASGVADWLGARGRGYELGISPVVAPIVPAAILFDLANGGNKEWGEKPPYDRLGRAACDAASREVLLGKVGAGFGARAGAWDGGIGSASLVTSDGLQVAALVAVNSFGSPVIPGTNCLWAKMYELDGEFGAGSGPCPQPDWSDPWSGTKAPVLGTNTTLAVVACNIKLDVGQAKRLAIMAQDGIARAIQPVHTPFDGDSVFALATARLDLPEPADLSLSRIGAMAANCLARAIGRGVYAAGDLRPGQSL